MAQFTFDVRLLNGEFDYVPFVALRSIDGAGVGVAEVDKCAVDVGGQRLDASTARHHHLRPRSDDVRMSVVDADVHQHKRRTDAVDVRRITRCHRPTIRPALTKEF